MEQAALPSDREAGVLVHISSLPGPHGIGDIGDAAQAFLDTLVQMKFACWQFLPLGPTGYGNSPYQALSSFAGNEMLIGLEPLQREGLLEPGALREIADAGAPLDSAQLFPQKSRLLDIAAERFLSDMDAADETEFEAFCARHEETWLDEYALYRVLRAQQGNQPWQRWDHAAAQRDGRYLSSVRKQHGQQLIRVRVHQYWFERQWQAVRHAARVRGIRLFGDLPIYVSADSADAWARRDLMQVGAGGQATRVSGVPPDYFNELGQRWGNPLYDWPRHEREGFDWWIRRVRRAMGQCDLLRLDHFRGFESYWSIPADSPDARHGQWEPGPGDALFEALREALGSLPLVAENLGDISDEVESLRERHGLPGMRVLQFELENEDFDPAQVEPGCVLYTGTHDNDTLKGWLDGRGKDTCTAQERRSARRRARRLTGGRAEELQRDLLRLAFSSPARLAIAPIQDLMGLGSEARMNTPGEPCEQWRWRLPDGQPDHATIDFCARTVTEASRRPPVALQSGHPTGSTR